MNILTGDVGQSSGGFASFATPHGTFRARLAPSANSERVKLFIRPEHMILSNDGGGENSVPVTIGDVAFEGNFMTVTAQADTGQRLTAELRNDGSSTAPERDKRMFMRFDPAQASILPDQTQ
jgi:spermidine/putrescine transport system ATP-binding protein